MRKIKSLVLAVIGLLCSLSVSAHDFEVDGIYYNITSSTDMTVEVTYRGYDYVTYWDEYSGAVTIPESVTYNWNTYSVTSIGDGAFYYCSGLTSVVIGNNVTTIGQNAFRSCLGLTSVEIPNSVTCIGDDTFYNCSSLTSVEIPNSVTSIGESAFEGCSNLTSVVIPNSVTSIGDWAFSDCSRLTTATVGCSWITNPLYEFDENVTVNATLHSYENGVCTVCGKEDTTGIDGITNNVHQQSEIFDLHGRRVNNLGKGLYIVNGKKVMMK
jgi:hypothetical protein